MIRHIYIDLCDTLVQGNTTFIFLDSFLKKNNRYKLYRKFSRIFLFRIFFKLMLYFSFDLNRIIALRFLKGFDKEVLTSHVVSMFQNEEYMFNKSVLKIINKAQSSYIPVTIFSASLDFIVSTVAERLNVNYISSTLSYTDNICDGFLHTDLLFAKNKYMEKKYGSVKQYTNICFISDNVQDVDLLKLCEYGYGVPTLKNKKIFSLHNIKLISYEQLNYFLSNCR